MIISRTARAVRLLPLAALFAAGGCFATRNDVRVVQADLASFRTEQLKANADSREALTVAMRTLAVASDSVKAMNNRLTALQGDVKGGLRAIDEQLLEVQALLKQSSSRLEQLRKDAEIRQNQMSVPIAPPTGVADTTSKAGAPVAATVGPREMYQDGRTLIAKGSWSTARSIFQDIVTNNPNDEMAPAAQLAIGQTFEGEKQPAAALAAYAAVYQKYPDSPEAPKSLYKRANILHGQNKDAEAKPLLQIIVTRFTRSDEYSLAVDLLKNMK
ncbi:MAG: tetratricopeptide repeat protein [Gemmatimonas sp.]